MLPSQLIMNNHFYCGEAEIIGNRPLTPEEEDFPIHYGQSKEAREKVLYLQCGRLCRKIPFGKTLFEWDFPHCGIGFNIDVRVPAPEACIREGSNRPYREQPLLYTVREYLRTPRLKTEREAVFKQFGLNAADYVKEEDGTEDRDFQASAKEPPLKRAFLTKR